MIQNFNNKIEEILFQSFEQNKSARFIIKQDQKKEQRLRFLIKYAINKGKRSGKIYLSKDEKSCAILIDKDKLGVSLHSFAWNILLIVKTIGVTRVFKILKYRKRIGKYEPKANCYHLWFIGVLPVSQGKGKGTDLLKKILSECGEKPIYLETSTEANFMFYNKLGFEELKTLVFKKKTLKLYRSTKIKPENETNLFAKLTHTETKVAEYIYAHKTYHEIGVLLDISDKTASKHGSNIYKKARCKSKKELRQILEKQAYFNHLEVRKADV